MGQSHNLSRRREGECRAEHGITWADPLRHQAEKEGIGSVATGERVSGTAKFGKPALELGHLAPHDEVRVVAHAQNSAINPRSQPATLRLQVDQGNRLYRVLLNGRYTIMHARSPAGCLAPSGDSVDRFAGRC